MLNYNRYLEIKNKYCFIYRGVHTDYVLQLLYLIPFLEKELTGLEIYIACKDEVKAKYPHNRLLGTREFFPIDFSHCRELKFNFIDHPIEVILKESNLTISAEQMIESNGSKKCVIISKGCAPNKSLNEIEINALKKKWELEGYQIEINTSVQDAGLVIGVESEGLMEAILSKIPNILIESGLGTALFKNIFPKTGLIKVNNSEIKSIKPFRV